MLSLKYWIKEVYRDTLCPYTLACCYPASLARCLLQREEVQVEERMCAGDVAVLSRLIKKEEEAKEEKGLGLLGASISLGL